MPRDLIDGVQQEGKRGVPEQKFSDAFPPEIGPVDVDEDTTYTDTVTDPVIGIFRPSIEWELSAPDWGPVHITESVRFGGRWVLFSLFGAIVVFLGELAGAGLWGNPTWGLALTVLGWAVLSVAYAVVAESTWLSPPALAEPDRLNQLSGLGILAAGCGMITIGADGPFVVLLSVFLVVAGIAETKFSVLDPLVTRVAGIRRRFPEPPVYHTLFGLVAAGGLFWYVSLSVDLTFTNPWLVALIGILVAGLTVLLLWRAASRENARVNVVVTAILTGLYYLFFLYNLVGPSQVTGPRIDQTNAPAMVTLSIGVLGIYITLWWLGIWDPITIQQEFAEEGRPGLHRSSATVAYTSIAASALLLSAASSAILTTWYIVQTGITIWFILFAVVIALPLAYFVSGTFYQLWHQVSLSTRFRRNMTPLGAEMIPYEPAHPVVTIPSGVLVRGESSRNGNQEDESNQTDDILFACAYSDVLGRYVVLSDDLVETLSPESVAAIVAHEESHLEHSGATIQFGLALAPLFGLMGKNVVYSIFDFLYREMTADQYAQLQLSEVDDVQEREALRDGLRGMKEHTTPEQAGPTPGFLPTMTKVNSDEQTYAGKLYGLFYGNFAGNVHLTFDDRVEAIDTTSRLDVDPDANAQGRAGVVLREFGYDRYK